MIYCTKCQTEHPDSFFHPSVVAKGKGWCKESFNDARRPQRRIDSPPRPTPNCLWCGKSLEGKRRHAKFCNSLCAMRHWNAEHRKEHRWYVVKSVYGLSYEQFEEIFNKQGRRCAICKTKTPPSNGRTAQWNIDHDHKTGHVRGILCSPCNMGLAQFHDDSRLLNRAAAYLKKPPFDGICLTNANTPAIQLLLLDKEPTDHSSP
jgi:hypothetical protein